MTSPVGPPDRGPERETAEEALTGDDPSGAPVGEDTTASGIQGGPTAVPRGQPGFREPPEDFVAAARTAPDHWLSVVDRHWEGEAGEPVPGWAVLGRWRSDEHGEIVEWEENTGYRPSPDAHGWPGPVSPADAAVQLVATGYGSEDVLCLVLADAEVAVCLDEQGGLAVTQASDGTAAVPVFSLAPDLERDRLPRYEVMCVPDLLDRLPEGKEVLFLSSSAPVGQLVTVSALRDSKAFLDSVEAEELGGGPEPGTGSSAPRSTRA